MNWRADPAANARARAYIARTYKPCHVCGAPEAGPLHRGSRALWLGRAERAAAAGGTDPVSGEPAAAITAHLEAIPA